ncbi:Far1 [Hordeum vulgare]|nr:Far1 [Hordeum vulgare]
MARPTTPNDTPENEVLNFKQNEEENLKDVWYRICNAQSRYTRSPPLMVNGTTLTLEHVMQRLDAIENKIATIELIEDLDRKIHNQITQYRSKVGMVLKNLREKEPIGNDSSRIGKLEDVITNLGSAFAVVQNTPNLTLKKTVKSVFVPKASDESSNKDEDLKMINDHTTYSLSTKDDYT